MINSHQEKRVIDKLTELRGRTVLVTGASGFIGSCLCQRLIQLGSEVHGVSRSSRQTDDLSMRWWQDDLLDATRVRGLLASIKPDIIFHLASHVTGGRDLKFVLSTFHSNLATTVNLLTQATALGCSRTVLVGSQEEPAHQDCSPVPCSPYAAAKWAGSAYARMFHALYETPVVVARVFMVYGPGQRDLGKLIPYAALSLLHNEPPRLSSGKREIDWIYVDDAVDGLILMGQKKGIEGSVIDLGSGSLVSIREVLELLTNLVGSNIRPLYGALPDRPMEQVRIANIKDTYVHIGWRPRTTMEKGLKNTINYYQKIVDIIKNNLI